MKSQLTGHVTLLDSKDEAARLTDEQKSEILAARENGDVPYVTVLFTDVDGNEVRLRGRARLSKKGNLTCSIVARVDASLTYEAPKAPKEKEFTSLAAELLSS